MPRPKGGKRALGPYYDRDRDTWYVVTRAGEGESGGDRKHRFATEVEALEFRDEFNVVAVTSTVTLDEALTRYHAHYIANGDPDVRRRTWIEVRRRILRLVGPPDTKLEGVSPKRAAALYDALVPLVAPDHHRGCLTYTKTFFAWALAAGVVTANPFADVKPVGKKSRGKPKLRRDEARAFRDAALRLFFATEDRVTMERYAMALVALQLGARASEITQRQVRDIDDDCTLYVIPAGKTENAERTERIPEELQPVLRRLVAGKAGTEYLFAGRYAGTGRHHDHRYVTRYCVAPLCAALGIPRVTAHGLRGTFADLALSAGEASLAVARSLGHADFKVTASHYAGSDAIQAGKSRKVQESLAGSTAGNRSPNRSPDGV